MSKQRQPKSARSGSQNPRSGVVMMASSKNALQPFRQQELTFRPVQKMFMRWAWKGTLTTSAGTAASQTFRLNSLYDPDYTGTGSQPRFYDTIFGATGGSAPYAMYRVLKTHFRVQLVNPNTTAAAVGIGFVHVTDDAPISDTAAFEAYWDTPNLVARTTTGSGSDNGVQVWEGTVDHRALFGLADILDDEDAIGAYNANPAQVDFLRVGFRPYDDSTAISVTAIAQFVYEVECLSLNAAGDS